MFPARYYDGTQHRSTIELGLVPIDVSLRELRCGFTELSGSVIPVNPVVMEEPIPWRLFGGRVTPEDVKRLIEEEIEDAEATVTHPRGEHDDDHLAAVVVSPAFEGESLVQQHQLVYDALGEHMTRDIHALELKTYTPDEYEDKN